jgi:hypothetical protein
MWGAIECRVSYNYGAKIMQGLYKSVAGSGNFAWGFLNVRKGGRRAQQEGHKPHRLQRANNIVEGRLTQWFRGPGRFQMDDTAAPFAVRSLSSISQA